MWQEFVPLKGAETFTLPLTKEESDLKKKLFDAHASQRQVFAKVSSNEEWLREAPDYNFRTPPNEGNVSHNFADAGIPLDRWLKRTGKRLTAFGL